jgi:putative oxidoreductase
LQSEFNQENDMALQEPIFVNLRGRPRGQGLRTALWVVQLLLALLFGVTGLLNLTQPIAVLGRLLEWRGSVPAGLVRFIGLAELAGAIGLVFPALTRIRPELTSWAAGGLILLTYLATLFHLAHGDARTLPMTLVVGALAGFVVWGQARVKVSPRDCR